MRTVEKEIKGLKRKFNNIGLYCDTDVCRLIGFADSGIDYYYILAYPSLVGVNPRVVYGSMVGSFVSLKGHYRRYKQLEELFTNIWSCPPQKEWKIETIKE